MKLQQSPYPQIDSFLFEAAYPQASPAASNGAKVPLSKITGWWYAGGEAMRPPATAGNVGSELEVIELIATPSI